MVRANVSKVYMTEVKAPSMAKAIRLKCQDCAESNNGVRDCHICHCPLWPYRFGKNPSAAINYLAQYYDVALIDISEHDYVEQTKGKRLKRPDLSKVSQNALESDLENDIFEDE